MLISSLDRQAETVGSKPTPVGHQVDPVDIQADPVDHQANPGATKPIQSMHS
jgi:hypothetical protein